VQSWIALSVSQTIDATLSGLNFGLEPDFYNWETGLALYGVVQWG